MNKKANKKKLKDWIESKTKKDKAGKALKPGEKGKPTDMEAYIEEHKKKAKKTKKDKLKKGHRKRKKK